ncbi:MAG: TonB-dependent receptor plug domain-containing protein, partial [Pseudomonadota bacterium]
MFELKAKAAIVLLFGTLFSLTVNAQNNESLKLPGITVTATPLDLELSEIAESTTVLQGESLGREQGNSIGETLARQPGIHNASFGQNVGRPVIRGFQGARVGVLNNGLSSADASTFSQDHAVPTEPLLLDQVEVIRGPATLLYGSGSIGGVVNMVSSSIPDDVPEGGFDGQLILQGDTAADERMGGVKLNFGQGAFAGSVRAFSRSTDDYEIPGEAELFHDEDEEEEEEEETGVLENSFFDNNG